jgi:AraC-like DNA-binding protein
MKSHEKLVSNKSDYFIYSPSITATQTFFYPICTGHFIYEPGYNLYRTSYDSFLLMYIHSGELIVNYSAESNVAVAGHFILLDCYQPHSYSTKIGCECTWIHFDGPMARKYYELISENCSPIFFLLEPYKIINQMDKIYSAFYDKEKIREPLVSKWLSDILTSILLKHSHVVSVTQRSLIEDTIAYIHEHFDTALTIDHLAEKAMLSPYHFIRVFKKETGYTPHEYIINIRINTAKYLLKSTELPVKNIAFNIGFTSESSFCTRFKMKVALTPLEYRKQECPK